MDFAADRFNNPDSAIILNDGYFSIPDGVYFNSRFTVSTWIRVVKFTPYARLFDFVDRINNENIIFSYSSQESASIMPSFKQFKTGSISGISIYSNTKLRLGIWEYLSFVYFDTNAQIYVNGNLTAEGTIVITPNQILTENFLGKSSIYSIKNANANFDELKIYASALTYQEIIEEMNN